MRFPSAIKLKVSELGRLPEGSFNCMLDGKNVVDYWELAPSCVVDVKLRFPGCRGGFGSLLRSLEPHVHKSVSCSGSPSNQYPDSREICNYPESISSVHDSSTSSDINAAPVPGELLQERDHFLVNNEPNDGLQDHHMRENGIKCSDIGAVAPALHISEQPSPVTPTNTPVLSSGCSLKRKSTIFESMDNEPMAKLYRYNWMEMDSSNTSGANDMDSLIWSGLLDRPVCPGLGHFRSASFEMISV